MICYTYTTGLSALPDAYTHALWPHTSACGIHVIYHIAYADSPSIRVETLDLLYTEQFSSRVTFAHVRPHVPQTCPAHVLDAS